MSQKFQKIRNCAQMLGMVCGGLLISLPAIPQAVAQQQTTPKVNPCPGIYYEEPYNNQALVPQGCPANELTQRLTEQGLLPVTPVPATPSPYQTRLGVGGEAPSALNPNPSIFNEPPYNRSQSGLSLPSAQTPVPSPDEESLLPSPGISAAPTRPSVTPISPSTLQPTQNPVAQVALANGTVNIRLVNATGANVSYQVIGDTPERSLEGQSDVTLRGLTTPITVTIRREDGGLLKVMPQPGSQSGTLEVTLDETTDINQDTRAVRIQNDGAVFLN